MSNNNKNWNREGIEFGEQSNQNWVSGNDYNSGYIFLSMNQALGEILSPDGWMGGVNMKSLYDAEQRSYGWYNYYRNHATLPLRPFLYLNYSEVGTNYGLSKFPYLRESRRSRYGLDRFRLQYDRDLNGSKSYPPTLGSNKNMNENENTIGNADVATSRYFYDTVAIGDYHYADLHLLKLFGSTCGGINEYPPYLEGEHELNPYFVPFRALTNRRLENVLIPGKGMAQSFLANAATRLHPTEWSTGVAVGAAAFLFVKNKEWRTTADILKEVDQVQKLLNNEAIKINLIKVETIYLKYCYC